MFKYNNSDQMSLSSDSDEFNLWNNPIKIFDHSCDSVDIIDIYIRASKECKSIPTKADTSVSIPTKADILAPYVEEFNQAWFTNENNMEFNFELARSLDNEFFPSHHYNNLAISTYWRAEFNYPSIDTVIYRPQFRFMVPKCGMIVIDHGLLTMKVCLNDQIIKKAVHYIDIISRKHTKYHQDFLISASSECDYNNEHCIVCSKKIKTLNTIISKISSIHYDYDELDELPSMDYDELDEFPSI